MSATSVNLLRAAADIVGGEKLLADRLGIGNQLLSIYMADLRPLPDWLLLKAVDIILANRQPGLALGRKSAAQSLQKPTDQC
jgi:hypothetical protein